MRRIIFLMIMTFITGSLIMAVSTQQHEEIKQQIEIMVNEEIEKGSFPGAVIYAGTKTSTILFETYGYKSTEPVKEEMTRSTIFDLASITKPVATATSVLILVEEGKIELSAPVGRYLPSFAQKGKESVQVKHLLTHTSGLPAYTNAQRVREKYGSPCPDGLIEEIYSLSLQSDPGKVMRYSCLGYIVLGRLVEEVSGQNLREFTQERLWTPLRMKDTSFNPPQKTYHRIAPTQLVNNKPRIGLVHDPLASLMDGISGNAGLFSTAEDLAVYSRMILNNGIFNKRNVLSEANVFFLTNEQAHGRTYGFDVRSSYSWIRGDYTDSGTISHSGYTGTSLVIDLENEIFIIILTNRSYPNDKGSVRRLRIETVNTLYRELFE